MARFGTKTASCILSLALFSQPVLGSMAEANFWKERRDKHFSQQEKSSHLNPSQQLAALPGSAGAGSSVYPPLTLFPGVSPQPLAPSSPFSLTSASHSTHIFSAPSMNAGEIFSPSAPSGDRVILILDVHQNREAQENIALAVSELLRKKNLKRLAAEGSAGVFDFTPFKTFPAPGFLKETVEKAFEENRVGALSYVGLTQPLDPGLLVGMEDQNLYRLNEAFLKNGLKAQRETDGRIEKNKQVLVQRAKALFSSSLWQLNEIADSWESGEAPFSEVVLKARRVSGAAHPGIDSYLSLLKTEKTLRMDQVNQERQIFISRFLEKSSAAQKKDLLDWTAAYRSGRAGFGGYYRALERLAAEAGVPLKNYPQFSAYVGYAVQADGLDPAALVAEVHGYLEKAALSFSSSQEEKDLWKRLRQVSLHKKLISFSLTEAEWLRLENKAALSSRGLSPYLGFYETADMRSERMARFLARSARKEGLTASVMGGFHLGRVRKVLREEKIPFSVFTPKITQIETHDGLGYLSAFAKEKTPLDRLFEGRPLLINPSKLNPGAPGQAEGATSRTLLMTSAALAAGAGVSLAEWKYGAVSSLFGGLHYVRVLAYGALSSGWATTWAGLAKTAPSTTVLGVTYLPDIAGEIWAAFKSALEPVWLLPVLMMFSSDENEEEKTEDDLASQPRFLRIDELIQARSDGKIDDADYLISLFEAIKDFVDEGGEEDLKAWMGIFSRHYNDLIQNRAFLKTLSRKNIWTLLYLYSGTSSPTFRNEVLTTLLAISDANPITQWIIPRRFIADALGDFINEGLEERSEIRQELVRELADRFMSGIFYGISERQKFIHFFSVVLEKYLWLAYRDKVRNDKLSGPELEGRVRLNGLVKRLSVRISVKASRSLERLLRHAVDFLVEVREINHGGLVAKPVEDSAYYFGAFLDNDENFEFFKELLENLENLFFADLDTFANEVKRFNPYSTVVLPPTHFLNKNSQGGFVPRPPFFLDEAKTILPPFWILAGSSTIDLTGGIIPGLYWLLMRINANRKWRWSENKIRRVIIPFIETGFFGGLPILFAAWLFQSEIPFPAALGAYVLGSGLIQVLYLAAHFWRGRDLSGLSSVEPAVQWKFPLIVALGHFILPAFLFLFPTIDSLLGAGALFLILEMAAHGWMNAFAEQTKPLALLTPRENDFRAGGAIDSTRTAKDPNKAMIQDLFFLSPEASPNLAMVWDGASDGWGEEAAFNGAMIFAHLMTRLKVFRAMGPLNKEPGPFQLQSPADMLGKINKYLVLATLGVSKKALESRKLKMAAAMAGIAPYRVLSETGDVELGFARFNVGDVHILHYSSADNRYEVISTDNDPYFYFLRQNFDPADFDQADLEEVFGILNWDWDHKTPDSLRRAAAYLMALKYMFQMRNGDWSRRNEYSLRTAQTDIEKILVEYVGRIEGISFINEQFALRQAEVGDRVIIISDGIYKNVKNSQDLLALIKAHPGGGELAVELVRLAREKSMNGGGVHDDMTAVVYNVDETWGRHRVFSSGKPIVSLPPRPTYFVKGHPRKWGDRRTLIPAGKESVSEYLSEPLGWIEEINIFENPVILELKGKIFELGVDPAKGPFVRFYDKFSKAQGPGTLVHPLLGMADGKQFVRPFKMFNDEFQIWLTNLNGPIWLTDPAAPFYVFDGTGQAKIITGQELPEIEDPHWEHHPRPPPGSATIPALVWLIEKIAGEKAAGLWLAKVGWNETLLFGVLPGAFLAAPYFILVQIFFVMAHLPLRNWLRERHGVSVSLRDTMTVAMAHYAAFSAAILYAAFKGGGLVPLPFFLLFFFIAAVVHQKLFVHYQLMIPIRELERAFPKFKEWSARIPLVDRVWGDHEDPQLAVFEGPNANGRPTVAFDLGLFSNLGAQGFQIAATQVRLALLNFYFSYHKEEPFPGSTLPRKLENFFNAKFSGREQIRRAVAQAIREKSFSGQTLDPHHPFLAWLAQQVEDLSQKRPIEAQRFLYTLLIGLGAFPVSRNGFVAGLSSGVEVLVAEQAPYLAYDYNPHFTREGFLAAAGRFNGESHLVLDGEKISRNLLAVMSLNILDRPAWVEDRDLLFEDLARNVRLKNKKPVLLFKHTEGWVRAFKDNKKKRGGVHSPETDRLLRKVFGDIVQKFRMAYPLQPIVVIDDAKDGPSVLRSVLSSQAYGDISEFWPQAIRSSLKKIEDRVVERHVGMQTVTTLMGRVSVFYPKDREWDERVEFFSGREGPSSREEADQVRGTIPVLVWLSEAIGHWISFPVWKVWKTLSSAGGRGLAPVWNGWDLWGGRHYIDRAGWYETLVFFFLPSLWGSYQVLAWSSALFFLLHFPGKNWLRIRHGVYPGRGVAAFNAGVGFALGSLIIHLQSLNLSLAFLAFLLSLIYSLNSLIHEHINENRMFFNVIQEMEEIFPRVKTKNLAIEPTVVSEITLKDERGIVSLSRGWDRELKIHISPTMFNLWKLRGREYREGKGTFKVMDFRIKFLQTYLTYIGIPEEEVVKAGFSLKDHYYSQTQDSTPEDLYRRAILLIHRFFSTTEGRTGLSKIKFNFHFPEGLEKLAERHVEWLAYQVRRNLEKAKKTRKPLVYEIEAQKMRLTLLTLIHALPRPGEGLILSPLNGKDFLVFEQAEGVVNGKLKYDPDLLREVSHQIRSEAGTGLRLGEVRPHLKGWVRDDRGISSSIEEFSQRDAELPMTLFLNHVERKYRLRNPNSDPEEFSDLFRTLILDMEKTRQPLTVILMEEDGWGGAWDVLQSLGYKDTFLSKVSHQTMLDLSLVSRDPAFVHSLPGEDEPTFIFGGKIRVFTKEIWTAIHDSKKGPEFAAEEGQKFNAYDMEVYPVKKSDQAVLPHPSYVEQKLKSPERNSKPKRRPQVPLADLVVLVPIIFLGSFLITAYDLWRQYQKEVRKTINNLKEKFKEKKEAGQAEDGGDLFKASEKQKELLEFLAVNDAIKVSEADLLGRAVKLAVSFEESAKNLPLDEKKLSRLRSKLTGEKAPGLIAGTVQAVQTAAEKLKSPVLSYHFLEGPSLAEIQDEAMAILKERMNESHSLTEIGLVLPRGEWAGPLEDIIRPFGMTNVHVVVAGPETTLPVLFWRSQTLIGKRQFETAKVHLYVPKSVSLADNFIPNDEFWNDRVRVFLVARALGRMLAVEVKDWNRRLKTFALLLKQA